MSISKNQLCFCNAIGTTEKCNLFTSIGDVGAHYLAVQTSDGVRYCPLTTSTSTRKLRVCIGGVTYNATNINPIITFELYGHKILNSYGSVLESYLYVGKVNINVPISKAADFYIGPKVGSWTKVGTLPANSYSVTLNKGIQSSIPIFKAKIVINSQDVISWTDISWGYEAYNSELSYSVSSTYW